MAIKVTGLLHAGLRIRPDAAEVEKAVDFWTDLMGMEKDTQRPHVPTIPGAWINVQAGDRGQQLHLLGADGRSAAARSEMEDPSRAHLAFAVADLAQAQAELQRKGVHYWVYESLVGSGSRQVFFEDPFGNMIELQQQDA